MKTIFGVMGGDFEQEIIPGLTRDLARAPDVDVGEWQAIKNPNMPQMSTIEVEDVSFWTPIGHNEVERWQRAINPNLPWAEEHFQERVSGVPHNPPPSHVRWPFAQRGNSDHTDGDTKFSHTYPERFWAPISHMGIRYQYGNLDDLVLLLQSRPGTRQAYLPVWFPEDLAAANVHQVRVPCTLGYHFLLRHGALKVTYYIRSCDFYRHFRDDVYMAGRLAQWICQRLNLKEEVVPSRLVMHISSLHIFSAERGRIIDDANRFRESQAVDPTKSR
jgi:thymidylate synthase